MAAITPLYCTDGTKDGLYIIDSTTGTFVEDVGSFLAHSTPAAMAEKDGRLFVWNNSPAENRGLIEVDPETGFLSQISVSSTTLQNLAFAGDTLYTVLGFDLYSIDIETGLETLVCPALFSSFGGTVAGLDVDKSTGIMYSLELSTNVLNAFEPATCILIFGGQVLSSDPGTKGSLVWNPDTNMFLASSITGNLFDLATDGTVSNVRPIANIPQGMAFLPEEDTTDPGDNPDNDGCTCFSGESTIVVKDQGLTKMSHLKIGDMVLTPSGFQPIYAFAHDDKTSENEFLRFLTIDESMPIQQSFLEMTAEHMVYVNGKRYPVRADSIVVGDQLMGELSTTASTVEKIETVQRKGLYAPMTRDGSLLVNGIRASCYVSLQDGATEYVGFQGGVTIPLSQHTLVHTTLSPVRMACLGISPMLCDAYNEQGLAYFVAFAFAIRDFAESQSFVVQVFLIVVWTLVFCPLALMEWIVGPTLSVGLVLGGVAFVSSLVSKKVVRGRKNKAPVLKKLDYPGQDGRQLLVSKYL